MRRGILLLLSSLLLLECAFVMDMKGQEAAACSAQQLDAWCASVPSSTPASCANCPKTYLVHSYQGRTRCLDYTPEKTGSPIVINDCARSHPIVVEEIGDGKHTVVLHAGTKVIGIKTNPVNTMGGTPPPITTEIPLQLQDLSNRPSNLTVFGGNHFFLLDGDSIILASGRNLVAKVQNARGAAESPVVLGPRQLADNEFWDFVATGGSAIDPTSGFVRIGYEGDPYCTTPAMCICRLVNVVSAAGEGTVVKLGTSIDLTDCPALNVGQGVTIRGDRRGTLTGPQLNSCYVVNSAVKCATVQTKAETIEPMVLLTEGSNDIRITGLRLRGPSRSTDYPQTEAIGVLTFEKNVRNIIDHNDVSDWPYIAIMTKAHDDKDIPTNSKCDPLSVNDPQTRPTTAFVARNFIHHNQEQNAGYGTESDWGAYPFIFANTFVSNRHAIAGGKGSAHTAYRAWYNLVLSAVPLQHGTLDYPFRTHDFDMHGLGDNGFGGIGGDYIDIYANTFFATNHQTFELRGDICNYAEFHNNISLESQGDSVAWQTCPNICWAAAGSPSKFRISGDPNQFDHSNPTSGKTALGVGDFDGDGADDLFLATGTGWYYSPAGKAEWRFLSAKTDTIGQLLFGDFDGDGRTDVVALHDGEFVVSWGGVSTWEVLNPNPTGGRLTLLPNAVSAMAVGDFDGNKIADIFWADGHTWWVSYGGNTTFKEVQTSSFGRSDLRFGDFNGDGKTDVFGVGEKNWQVSYAPASGQGLFSTWQPLRPRLTDSAANLIVADFNGDGFADVATDCTNSGCWRISYRGFENWFNASQPVSLSGDFAGVGHFRAAAPADILTWNDSGKCDQSHGQNTQLCISVAGFEPATHYSTQDMR